MTSDPQQTKCPQCGRSFPRSVKLCPNDGAVLEHGEGVASHIGDVLDGKYRLDAFLSQGGMGAVYKATHVMLGRTVAVKLINPDFVTSTEAVRRFQREARAATSLNHPNIVSVFDLGQTPQGTLYIAMEFVDGPSLKSVITKGGPLAPMRMIPLLRQVASALGAAHRHNIVHRDLKPQNIMIAQSVDGHEIAKLVDFGIAKTFDEATQLTSSGLTMGTPQYMAPEQAAGQPVDGRTDIYSLGIVMYEMLSGDVPFNDKSVTAIIIKQMKEAPQPPSLKNPGARVPEALEATVLKCLEKDPANRFQTAEEFTAALQGAAHLIHGVAEVLPGQAAILENQPTIPANQSAMPVTPAATVAGPPTARKSEPLPSAPSTVRMSPDTRSTAVRPAAAQSAERAVASKPATASNIGILAALVSAILVAFGGAVYYVTRSANSTPSSVSSEVPTATPAGANSEPAPAVPAGASSAVPASALPQGETPAAKPTQAPGTATTATVTPVESGSDSDRARADNSQSQTPPPTGAAVVSRNSRATGSTAASGANPAAQTTQAAQFPENPAVYFHCSGPSEICSALRVAVDEALDNGGLSAVRQAPRADIDVAATVEGVQETVSNQFQTTFAVRTYSIDVVAETTRTSEGVSMPSPSNLSFDPQFGSARIAERARLVAADIVDRVKAFAKKKRGG